MSRRAHARSVSRKAAEVSCSSYKEKGCGVRKRRDMYSSASAGSAAGSANEFSAGFAAGSNSRGLDRLGEENTAGNTPSLPSPASLEVINASLAGSGPPGNLGRHVSGDQWNKLQHHRKDLVEALGKDGRKRRKADYTKEKKEKKRQEKWLVTSSERFAGLTTKPKARAKPGRHGTGTDIDDL